MKKIVKIFIVLFLVTSMAACQSKKIKKVSLTTDLDTFVEIVDNSSDKDKKVFVSAIKSLLGDIDIEVSAYFDKDNQKLEKYTLDMIVDVKKLYEEAKQEYINRLKDKGIGENSKQYQIFIKEFDKEHGIKELNEELIKNFNQVDGYNAISDENGNKLIIRTTISSAKVDQYLKKYLDKNEAEKYYNDVKKQIKNKKIMDKVKIEIVNY